MVILENIDINIDIDKAILQNIDIDKISNRFKFGISNRARLETDFWQYEVFCWQWRQALPWHCRHIEGNVPLLSLVLLCQS